MADLFSVTSDGKVKANLRCTECPLGLNANLHTNCMRGAGSANPDFMFVGMGPGVEDDGIGKPFTGKNGRLLRDLLRQGSIEDSRCFYTNLVRCAPYDVELKDTHFKSCQPHFVKELKRVKPKAIVSLGAKALTWLTGHTGVRQFRRCGIPCLFDPDIYVYPLQQPLAITHAETQEEADQLKAEMVSDIIWLKKKADDGTLHTPDDTPIDYQLATTLEDVRAYLAEFPEGSQVCFDLETCTRDWEPALRPVEGCDIAIYAFSKGPGHARVIPGWARGITTMTWWTEEELTTIKEWLKEFFLTRVFHGSNAAKFDAGRWIRKILGVYPKVDFDTQYNQFLIDENLARDLESMAVQWAKVTPWKPPKLSQLMKNTPALAKYASRDVDSTFRVRLAQPYDPRMKRLMEELLIPLSYEFSVMEENGLAVSEENLTRFGNYIEELLTKHDKNVRAMPVVQQFELTENLKFNPNAPAHVGRIMEHYLKLPRIKTTKGGGYGTDNDVLENFLDVDFVQSIYLIRKLGKQKSSYWQTIYDRTRVTNLIHTDVRVDGTVTGRASSKDPNVFTPPRPDTIEKTGITDPTIAKAIFIARNIRRKLVAVDLSQIELRVLAILSGDEGLIEIYRSGQDLHKATAAKAFGIPIEQVKKGQRSQAKSLNFGIVYGQTEKGLAEQFISVAAKEAKKEGRPFTEADRQAIAERTREFIAKHKATFPKVWAWMALQERLSQRNKFLETPTGRRRHFERVGAREARQSYNFPVQSWASDLCYYALLWTNQAIRDQNLDALFVLTIYDSLVWDCHEDCMWEVASLGQSIMEEALPAAFPNITVPIVAEPEIGNDLGNMYAVNATTKEVYFTCAAPSSKPEAKPGEKCGEKITLQWPVILGVDRYCTPACEKVALDRVKPA